MLRLGPLERVSSPRSQVYADFSHVTWMAGTTQAWAEWSADLFGLLHKYNPPPRAARALE
jgi:hypothetical protein